MTILIIRHGESEADILNVHEGRADFGLTERGHRQAEAMAEFVADSFKPTAIYSSPLKRAAQTAGHLSEKTGVEIVFDPDLMEFNNGLLAGLSFEEADRLYPKVENLPIDRAVYGQESQVEFRARAERALGRILSENGSDAVVAVVTHGGMTNQLYGAFLGIPVTASRKTPFFCTSDTGIHLWSVTDHGSYVIRTNVDAHTRGI
ncbi:MAG: histidine phosphatase family protein [Clostridia bacterium]|nr:histidine phosphatase family protein [Clostridia bacterium]